MATKTVAHKTVASKTVATKTVANQTVAPLTVAKPGSVAVAARRLAGGELIAQ